MQSLLENIFLSRQRWTGFSNVSAKNDGVMSLQVGRKWPNSIPSTIEWFYHQCSNIALERIVEAGSSDVLQTAYIGTLEKVW